MNDPLVMVERWSSSPMISTAPGRGAVSSHASRKAVARRSASSGVLPAAREADLAAVRAQVRRPAG